MEADRSKCTEPTNTGYIDVEVGLQSPECIEEIDRSKCAEQLKFTEFTIAEYIEVEVEPQSSQCIEEIEMGRPKCAEQLNSESTDAEEIFIVDNVEGEVLIDGRNISCEESEGADSIKSKESEDERKEDNTLISGKKNIPKKRRRLIINTEEDTPYEEHHYAAKSKSKGKNGVKSLPQYKLSKQSIFSCGICSAEFTQNGNLKRHMMTHTGEKPFRCYVCNASFNQKVNLNKHLRTHIEESSFHLMQEDEIMEVTTSAKKNILKKATRHGTDTEEETPFEELYGTKSKSKRKNGASQHVLSKQSFTCNVCSAEFTQNGNLKRHMMTHTGEKPFKCDICDASFNQKVNLNKHLRRHDREEPFRCDTCDIKFSDETNLNNHLKRHTDDTPYYLVYVGK